MKNKFKAFFTDPFNWNVAAAVLGILCTGIFIWEARWLLAIIWAAVSGIDIACAYIEAKNRRK